MSPVTSLAKLAGVPFRRAGAPTEKEFVAYRNLADLAAKGAISTKAVPR